MSYQLIELNANLDLSWVSPFTGGTVVCDKNNVQPNRNGWILCLPQASFGSLGQTITFNNISNFSFDLYSFGAVERISTIAAGEVVDVYLTDNSDSVGAWSLISYGSSSSALTALTIDSPDNSVNVTGGVISPPGGIVGLTLPPSINNLNNLNNGALKGFIIPSSLDPLNYTATSLFGDNNITVDNADGVLGDPTITLNPTLNNLISIQLGNITIGSDEISATNGLTINKNCVVSLDGDLTAASITTTNLTISGALDAPCVAKAWLVFSDDNSAPPGNITIANSFNISTVIGSQGSYNISFITPIGASPLYSYAVNVTLFRVRRL